MILIYKFYGFFYLFVVLISRIFIDMYYGFLSQS